MSGLTNLWAGLSHSRTGSEDIDASQTSQPDDSPKDEGKKTKGLGSHKPGTDLAAVSPESSPRSPKRSPQAPVVPWYTTVPPPNSRRSQSSKKKSSHKNIKPSKSDPGKYDFEAMCGNEPTSPKGSVDWFGEKFLTFHRSSSPPAQQDHQASPKRSLTSAKQSPRARNRVLEPGKPARNPPCFNLVSPIQTSGFTSFSDIWAISGYPAHAPKCSCCDHGGAVISPLGVESPKNKWTPSPSDERKPVRRATTASISGVANSHTISSTLSPTSPELDSGPRLPVELDATDFQRMPTWQEWKRKPLPPRPPEEEPQETFVQPPSPKELSADQPGRSAPVFLPLSPRASDLDTLDDAFRRSGLLIQRQYIQPSQPLPPPPHEGSSRPYTTSIQQATDALEAHLSKLPPSTVTRSQTTTSVPQLAMNMAQCQDPPRSTSDGLNDTGKSQPRSRRRTLDIDKLKSHASFRVNASFRSKKARDSASSGGKSKPQEDPRKNDKPTTPTSLADTSPSSRRSHIPMTNPALSDKVNRSLSFARNRMERNPRLRLPRLETTVGAERNHLSVVVESPAELDGRSPRRIKDESTATEKIITALYSTDQPVSGVSFSALERVSEEGKRSPPRRMSTSKSIMSLNSPPAQSTSEIPLAVAEEIVLQIMGQVDDLQDLFSLAVVNRGFYRVLKKNELPLIKSTLFHMSPAAWELREMCPPWDNEEMHLGKNADVPVPEYTASSYMHHYMRDVVIMIALKSRILHQCNSFLRPDTVRALRGEDEGRSAELDDAFWRVWTFCCIFGCGKSREEDIAAQADWLSGGRLAACDSRGSSMALNLELGANSLLVAPPPGFSKGNGDGLNSRQLCDMMEIWTCLGVLLQVFHGKCEEARKYGVFDKSAIEAGDIANEAAFLESWTQYLMTLGPSAILALIGEDSDTSVETMLERARLFGWTNWTSPTKSESGTCRLFLKEAVSRAYDYQLVRQETTPRSLPTPTTSQSSSGSRSPSPGKSSQTSVSDDVNATRQRQADFAAELRKQRQETQDSGSEPPEAQSSGLPITDDRPLSSFQEVMQKLDDLPTPAPMPGISEIVDVARPYDFGMPAYSPPSYSPPLRRTRSAAEEKISQGRHPYPTFDGHVTRFPAPEPQVLDPADIALNKMVNELGFNVEDAKWALKYTDTGESLDVEAAINLLLQRGDRPDTLAIVPPYPDEKAMARSNTTSQVPSHIVPQLPPTPPSDLVWRPTWRWA